MEDKLLPYQVPHFLQLVETLKQNDCILDASDTGTGKTYVALALAKEVNREPFVICPKSVIPNWINVAKFFGIKLFGVSNYEMLKGCKYFVPDKDNNFEKVDCPYMDKIETEKAVHKGTKKILDFVFHLPSNVLVIFDEAHRCKNYQTVTSRLLLSINKSLCKTLLLSATISDKIDCFKPFGVTFGFYDETKQFKMWLRKIRRAKKIHYENQNISEQDIPLDIIHNKIFPYKGSRMKIKDLGDMFPQNQVITQAYYSQNQDEIDNQYKIIRDAFEELKVKESRSDGLGKLVRARMKIEMLKVPIMLDVIQEGLDNGYSIVVFVNFIDTMNYLAHYFNTECLIHGGQSLQDRQDSIDRFQENKSNIIISIIQAGGVGISLHDIHGGHPRMSVISPTWSGQDTQQALGRIHRAGSKSPALQRMVYVAGTFEERICELIQSKLKNITGINDRDLVGPQFDGEDYEEIDNNLQDVNKEVDNINNENNIDEEKEDYVRDNKIKKDKPKKFVKVVKNKKKEEELFKK